MVGIQAAVDRRIGTYSKGMLQRLGLAQALLHEPDLLIADEPASGLDPEGQSDMAILLQQIRAGHTLFLCTHQLTEVARLCDRVGVLVKDDSIRYQLIDLQGAGTFGDDQSARPACRNARSLSGLGSASRVSRTEITMFPFSEVQTGVLAYTA